MFNSGANQLSPDSIVDAHKNDGKCYIVELDELLSAFLELE